MSENENGHYNSLKPKMTDNWEAGTREGLALLLEKKSLFFCWLTNRLIDLWNISGHICLKWFLTLLSGHLQLYIFILNLCEWHIDFLKCSTFICVTLNGAIAITLVHSTTWGHFSICHFLTRGNQRWFPLIRTHSIQCICNKVKLDPQCYLMGTY